MTEPSETPPRLGAILAPTSVKAAFAKAAAALFRAGDPLLSSVDLSAKMPPPGDQGHESSSVAWATTYGMKSYEELVEENIPLANGGVIDQTRVFSPAFVYNQINHGADQGSLISDALNVLQSQGAATWADMPYVAGDYVSRPSSTAVQRAARYHIAYWTTLDPTDLLMVKSYLAGGIPVVIGINVDEGFAYQRAGQVWSGRVGNILGGHAVLVVGYDDGRRAFKILNSWGRGWSDNGFGWIGYDWFPQAAVEAYIAKDAPNTGPAPTPTPTPAPEQQATFTLSNIAYNVQVAGAPGLGMAFTGNLSIPRGTTASRAQVVVFFTFASGPYTGRQVASGITQYATVYGTAATGTPPLPLTSAGITTTWQAALPYLALIPWTPGENDFYATPVLFVDNFPVKQGTPIPFFVFF